MVTDDDVDLELKLKYHIEGVKEGEFFDNGFYSGFHRGVAFAVNKLKNKCPDDNCLDTIEDLLEKYFKDTQGISSFKDFVKLNW